MLWTIGAGIAWAVLRDWPQAVWVAVADLDARGSDPSDLHLSGISRGTETLMVLVEPVAYFIPEHIADPSRRPPGEQLWVEATIPASGPPRPIRLGVKKGDGPVEPLRLD